MVEEEAEESDDEDDAPHSSQGSTRLPSSDSQPARRRESTYPDESLDTQGIRELIRDGADRREQTNLRILRSQQDPRDDDDDDDDDDEIVESEPPARPALPPEPAPIETGSGWYSEPPPPESCGFSDDGRDAPPPRRGRSTTTSAAATDIVEDTPRFSDDGRRGPSIGSATRCSPAPRASQGSETLPPSPSNVEAAAPSQEETQTYQQPPERFEYTRPVNVARGQALPGEYTFDEEAESIDDDGDDDDLDPHPHRRLPPAAGSRNSLAAQSQAEDTPRPPRPRAADPGEPSLPWQPAKGLKGFSLGSSPASPAAAPPAAPPTAGGSSSDESEAEDEFDMSAAMEAPRPAPAPARTGSNWLHASAFRSTVRRVGPGMRNRPMGSFRPPRPVGKRK